MRPPILAWLIAAPMLGAPVAPAATQELHVDPTPALVDEIVHLRVTGLAPGSQVVLRAERADSTGRMWRAAVRFRADARGAIDPATMPSDSGTYVGVHPMGLFTAMDADGEPHGRARWSFGWRDTLRTAITVESRGRVVARDTAVQTFIALGVTARPMRDSGLVGTLFLPRGGHDRVGALVLGGSEGGFSGEEVAAQLASRGVVALALAYFGAEQLPPALDRIPLEYFSTALRVLARQPGVAPHRLAIVATSKGAEAALLVAVHDTLVRAVVAYAPSSVVWSCICAAPHASWTRKGLDLPFVPAGADPRYHPAPGTPIRPVVNYNHRLRDSITRVPAAIPVERIRGPLLLVAGADDGLWPSAEMARAVIARRRAAHVPYDDVLLEYPGAGHLIGKAYLPAGGTIVGGGRLETGGLPAANAEAQADAWPRALELLRRVGARDASDRPY